MRERNREPNDKAVGLCLGANGINTIMKLVQNAIIDRGYVTTRILAQPQDLKSGKLTLTVVPGKVGKVKFDKNSKRGFWRSNGFGAIPFYGGNILNLRDIEQGLENLKRAQTVEADIKISPGAKPNESNLIIATEQKKVPFHGSISLDDTGTRSTGKIQINVTLAFDNPFSVNDLFYFNFGRDVLGYDRIPTTDDEGNSTGRGRGGVNNWSAYYSVPFGKWQLALDANSYSYNQLVAGANQTLEYKGRSSSQNITLSRMLYRDRKRKLTGYVKGWTKSSNNFIDDTEIDVQRRRTAGYELGAHYKEFFGQKTLGLEFGFRKGTGANGSLRAPEELFGEGTSRMAIFTAGANFNMPFEFKKKKFVFNTSFRGQLNKTPLVVQDKFSIGDRNTVRGFDGDRRLLADRGFNLRNELGMKLGRMHQVYAGLDGGHVFGSSTEFLIGNTLIGGAIGIRGQVKQLKNVQYDAFVGTPISKPSGFRTDPVTYGFNLVYRF